MSGLPTHCFSCGEPIGHLGKIYSELVLKYLKEAPAANTDPKKEKSAEDLTFKELEEKHDFSNKYCCRIILLCNHDATNIIK